MPAPRLALYASRSCAPREWHLPSFTAAIRKSGSFQGIELSLSELGRDATEQRESADAIKTAGLHLIVNVSSSFWGGGRNSSSKSSSNSTLDTTPADHIKTFESQLASVSALGDVVTHINCHNSGNERWDVTMASNYLSDVLSTSAQYLEDNPHIGRYGREVDIMGGSPHHLTGISHEMGGGMGGGGILYCPDRTRELLEILPPLRMTLDVTNNNWYSMSTYVDGGSHDDADAMKVEIIPHIDHIRARIVSLFEPAAKNAATINKKEKEVETILNYHKTIRNQVWSRKASRGVEEMSITIDAAHKSTCHYDVAREKGELLPSEVREAAKYCQRAFQDWTKHACK